jgi:hypothetical protein
MSKLAFAVTKKKIIAIVATVIIVISLFASYEVLTSSKASSNSANFQIRFQMIIGSDLPTQIQRGTQAEVGLVINHTRSDVITLKTSGSAASWAYFAYYTEPPYHMLAQNQTTVTDAVNGELIVIQVPDTAQTGTYQITVTGTNTVGEASSATYSFAVT